MNASARWIERWSRAASVMALCVAAGSALGQGDPRDLIRMGIEHYHAGDLRRAATLFDEARHAEDAPIEATFNLAVVLAHLGRRDEAAALFREVEATRGCPPSLAEAARYNIGRMLLDQGLEEVQGDPRAAMDTLHRAEGAFRDVLRHNAGDHDAARNLEYARLARRQLREAIEQAERMNDRRRDMARQAGQLAQQQQDAGVQTRQQRERSGQPQQQAPPQTQPQPESASQGQPQPQEAQGQPPPQSAPGTPEPSEPVLTPEQLAQLQQMLNELTGQLQQRLDEMREELDRRPSDAGEPRESPEPGESAREAPPQEEPVDGPQHQSSPRPQIAPQSPPANLPQPDDSELRQSLNQAQESLEQARAEQREASEALQEGDLEGAQQHQQRAAGHLRDAAEQLRPEGQSQPVPEGGGQPDQPIPPQDQPQDQSQSGQDQQGQQPQSPPGKGEQAQRSGEGEARDDLVQRLLERERLTREMRDSRERTRVRQLSPVEKDW